MVSADLEKMSVSVVVPVYQSAASLSAFYERCSSSLDEISNDWEIILVNDASSDESWRLMCELNAHDPRVKIICFARNQGQQHATLCGLNYASKDYIFTIDDDLQCFPEDFPLFINLLKAGKQIVIGKINPSNKQHNRWRNLASGVNQYLAGRIIGKPDSLGLSSYRAMTRRVVQDLVSYKGAHPHIAALLFKSTPLNLIANVEIRHAPRKDGNATTYSISKLIKTMSYLIINHSYLPLRFMIAWGVTISIFSILFALFVVVRAVFSEHIFPGWASLAVLTSFLSGNILFALGILGEYLGRLVEETSNIKQFSIFEERL
jgi:glycosyltransferase involved in cell wall biosynthesis